MPTALGLADLSTLTLRVGTAAFKRTLMGVLEHPQPPPGYATVSDVNSLIQTKILVHIHIDLGYHSAVSKVDYD